MGCVVERRIAWGLAAAGLLLTAPLVHAEELAGHCGEEAGLAPGKAARFDGDTVTAHARAWASMAAAGEAEGRAPRGAGSANILAEASGDTRRVVGQGGFSAEDYNRFAAALGTDAQTRAKVESLLRTLPATSR